MHAKGPYGSGGTDVRCTFKTPEGAYTLKGETRLGQVFLNERQASRMTLAHVADGPEKGEYIILNVGDALHVLQCRDEEQDAVKVVYFRRDVAPTCHAFAEAEDDADLVVGLSTGEVMLLSLRTVLQGIPFTSQASPIAVFDGFDRLEDEVQCTAVVWTSKTDPSHFLATYSDGNLRIFEKARAGMGLENRIVVRGVNPEATMDIEGGCIHDAAISPDGSKLAVASKDGVLRVFCAQSRQLETGFQSYYGGLLCCAWSPDSKYVATGGEDDLVTVFSLEQGCVIAFGEGHTSWISQVAFDSGVEAIQDAALGPAHEPSSFIYRVGSVSQDTRVALWDFEVDLTLATPRGDSTISSPQFSAANGAIEEEAAETSPPPLIAPAIPHRDMILIPPVMLHKLHADPITDIVFTSTRMFTCDWNGHVRYWAKPSASPTVGGKPQTSPL